MSKVDLSFIIVSFNTAEMLRACLQSIYNHVSIPGFEVIVVDNASTDDSVRIVREEFPQAALIENKDNIGYSRAINQGIEKARGEFCAVMNSDIEFTGDIISPAVEYIKTHSNTGAVGCMLVFPDGRPQRSFFKFPTLRGRLAYFTGINRLVNAEFIKKRRIKRSEDIEVEVISGAFFVVNRKVLLSIGGFDPDYFLYQEEADAFYRLRKAGYRNVILSNFTLVHHGRHGETADNPVVYFHRNRSLLLYFRKNRSRASLWMLICMNVFFLVLKLCYNYLPIGDKPNKKLRCAVHLIVLKLHLDFITLLMGKKDKQSPG